MSFRFYTTAALILAVFGFLGASILSTPDVAKAQGACRVENPPGASVSVEDPGYASFSDSDQQDYEVTFSSYLNSGEEVRSISYTLAYTVYGSADRSTDSGNYTVRARTVDGELSESGSLDGSSGGASSDQQSFTHNLSSSDSSFLFELTAQANGSAGIDVNAEAEVKNIELTVCDAECRVVTLSGSGGDSSSASEQYGSNWESDDREYSYTSDSPNTYQVDIAGVSKSADEEYAQLRFDVDGTVDVSEATENTGADAAVVIGGTDPYATADYRISASGPNGGDSINQIHTRDLQSNPANSLDIHTRAAVAVEPGNRHSAYAGIGVSSFQLDICEVATPNSSPTAQNDGEPSDRICTAEPGTGTVTINVLKNDSDPDGDSLSIDSFPTLPSKGAVSIATEDGQDVVAYTPSTDGDDSFRYQISDGNGGTDTATVYVTNPSGPGCGQVVADISASIQGTNEIIDEATVAPTYDGTKLKPLYGGDAAASGWNVELSETPRTVEIRRENVELPEGYTLPSGPGWIAKSVEHERTGQQNTAELGISHNLIAPTSSFTYSPSSPEPGEIVSFDASGSTDSDGSITSYAWNFGDGSTASGITPTHSFSSDGTYSVDLTVTDDDGETDTSSQSISVNQPNRAPTAGFNWSIMNDPCSGTYAEVAFDGASFSSDPDGDSLSYSWTFGDGGTASMANPIHYYPAGSTDSDGWNVRLTVSDGEYSDTHQDGVVISCDGGGGGGGGTEPIELR